MAITYTWTVTNMSVLQTPQPDFVVNVQWQCVGVEDTYTATQVGITSFEDVQGDEFTPYADLTETQVLAWVWESIGGKESTEATVEGLIEAEKQPPVTPQPEPLPW
mgnify:CR=1 FL=1